MRSSAFFLCALAALLLPAGAAAQAGAIRGIIQPFHDVTLSVTVTGTVTQILKNQGDTVRAGDEILELDKDLESLEVERRRRIWESKAELEQARQRLATLTQQLASTQALYAGTHSVSEDDLRQKQLEVTLGTIEVQRLDDAEEQQKIEYDIARAQLARRTILAPFDGVIVKLFVDLGDSLNPPQQVARIVDVSKCRLIAQVSAASSLAFKVGMPVRVEVPGMPVGSISHAAIDYVAPVVDPSSGLREIRVLFDNAGGVLPGLMATVLP